MISGDSGEYEFLTDAIQLAADVDGMALEIGLRLGFGTKTIIDAVAEYCPDKLVVSIDPYGSILYQGREGQICRLDYTESMRNECLGDMFPYAQSRQVHWKFMELTDTDFFDKYKDGVIVYDLVRRVENTYSMIHFDGPHYVECIKAEIDFFAPRTSVGGIWCFDDTTPDFYDHTVIHSYLLELGFELVKQGVKKALYRKL